MSRRTPPAARRIRDPARSRSRIVEAAVVEFAAKGYAGARVGEIAARAGVNKQLISYYFGGKKGLYHHLGQQWNETEEQDPRRQDDRPLPEVVASYVPRTERERDLARVLAWEGLGQDGEDPGFAERTERMRTAIEGLRRRQAAGELSEDLDVRAFLLVFMSAPSAPAVTPHLVRSIFGVDPDSTEFLEWYAAALAGLVRLLAPGSSR